MNISIHYLRYCIIKVSTPLSLKEGLGVRSFFRSGIALMLLLLAACGPDDHHGRVEGKISGVNEADIVAYVEDSIAGDCASVDSVKIKRGKFTYDRAITQPTVLTLLYPNFSTTSLVLTPGKTVRLKGDGSRLGEIEVDGNEDNILLSEFRARTNDKSEAELRREAATFVRSHPASLAAVVVFRDVFANAATVETNPTASLLTTLKQAQPDNALLKQIAARVEPLLATAKGATLPAFTVKDIDGKTISSADYKGKNLLLVFCAQWDGSFFLIKRSARNLREQVSDDRLAYLFVSLDASKEKFRLANDYDPLPGRVAFDGKALRSPLIRQLGMRYVSSCILVGCNGKVIDRDIPVEQWTSRIPSLL